MIENTGNRDPLLHLLGAMSEGTDKYITGMEAAGQQQVVNSALLPTKGSEDLAALGFTLGEVQDGDPLFREVTLPDGWRKEASDHDMWSHVVDPLGRKRVAVFYKAAFYDRKAFCRVESVENYVWSLSYKQGAPTLDQEWCVPAAVVEAAQRILKDAQETVELWTRPGEQPSYAAEYAAEARKTIEWAKALIASVS